MSDVGCSVENFQDGYEDIHLDEGLLAPGLGYQGAGVTYVDDIDRDMPDSVYNHNNVFVEGARRSA